LLRRWPLSGRPLLAALCVILLALAVALGIILTRDGGHRIGSSPSKATTSSSGHPTGRVAVLNATSTAGAARTLAQQLSSQGIKVTTIGNVAASRPPGLEILYAPGARAQATRLARTLANRAPVVGPIDPAVQAAAGADAQIVVVIG
jgi:hypothetical protein